MSDLVAFLRARLAEDEQTAQTAVLRHGHWMQGFGSQADPSEVYELTRSDLDRSDGCEGGHPLGEPNPCEFNVLMAPGFALEADVRMDGVAAHVARHDPARVLADVAAKRRLIDALGPIHEAETGIRYGHERYVACSCGWDRVLQDRERHDWEDRYEEHLRDEGAYGFDARPFLLVLAQPFADHPEFDPAWRQTT